MTSPGVGAGGVAGAERRFDCGFDGHPVLRFLRVQDSTFSLRGWFPDTTRVRPYEAYRLEINDSLRFVIRIRGCFDTVIPFDCDSALKGAQDLISARNDLITLF